MACCTVRVVDEDDEGVGGVRVRIEFTSITRGMSDAEYTDSDGRVDFGDYDEGEIRIYIDGSDYGTYEFEDGGEITIAI